MEYPIISRYVRKQGRSRKIEVAYNKFITELLKLNGQLVTTEHLSLLVSRVTNEIVNNNYMTVMQRVGYFKFFLKRTHRSGYMTQEGLGWRIKSDNFF